MQGNTKEQQGWWRSAAGQLGQVRSLTGGGLLAAIGVALKSLSIQISQTLRINFLSFPIAVAGFMYGPVVAGLVGVAMDTVSYLIRPMGPYFPGFAVLAFVEGVLYGLWLYRQPVKLWRVACAVLTSTLLISFIANPLMLQMLYGVPYWASMTERLVKNAVLVPTYIGMIYIVIRALSRQPRLMPHTK